MPPCGGHERLSDPIHSVYLLFIVLYYYYNKDYSKRCSSIGIIQRTVYTYAKLLNMKHMR